MPVIVLTCCPLSKTWYAVPDSAAEHFEEVMRQVYPEFHKRMPDLHYRKCLMMSPQHLKEAGVPVYRAVQHANQIVITFPKAYHGGFSHGFNWCDANMQHRLHSRDHDSKLAHVQRSAESTNFALPGWLSYGSDSAEKYREASVDTKLKTQKKYGRDTIIGIDKLLWDICVTNDAKTFNDAVVTAAKKVRRGWPHLFVV